MIRNVYQLRSEIIPDLVSLNSFDEAKRVFLLTCQAKNLSRLTIEGYERRLADFERFLNQNYNGLSLNSITKEHIQSYICFLQGKENPLYKGRKLSTFTVSGAVRSLRPFFNTLHTEGYLSINPIEKLSTPKTERKIIKPLSEDEIRRLLAAPDKKTFTGFMYFLLMLIFLDTGLRLNELLSLKISGIDWERKTFCIMGKGAKEREVPFGIVVAKNLVKFLKWRESLSVQKFVFINRHGMKHQPRRVQETIRRYGEQAGIEKLHPHRFRHSAALAWIKAGGDVLSLQRLLGHSSLDMTRIYVSLVSSDVSEKHRQFGLIDRLCLQGGGKKRNEKGF